MEIKSDNNDKNNCNDNGAQLLATCRENLSVLLTEEGFDCSCGRHHAAAPLKILEIGTGVMKHVADGLSSLGVRRPFVVMGSNGARVAGENILSILDEAEIPYTELCLDASAGILPNEEYCRQIESVFPRECDFILGIGSGVINDLCKYTAWKHGLSCGIVATAPSMDGYASNSSAMELNGIKTTVYTTCPAMVLCDTEILRNAPMDMLRSGFGDMAAKMISIADWRIAHLVTGEYYCDILAEMMLDVCRRIIDSADGILGRKEDAIHVLTEGLVLSGILSSFACTSRPASGMEHTVSHLLEMFALAKERQPAFHGLQVGYGLRAALKLYEYAQSCSFAETDGKTAAESFDQIAWEKELQKVFGTQAETLIANAAKEKRNLPETRLKRVKAARENLEAIREIIDQTLAEKTRVSSALDRMEIPPLDHPEILGYTKAEAENAVYYSKDLRARYIFTSLLADFGYLRNIFL